MPTTFQRIWLPGLLFQSVIVGGGYATGRELVEFFLSAGPLGGMLAMLVATVAFSLIAALCFELARITRSYSYRHFFRQLLDRYWFVYELAYFSLGLLVLAVIGAAAGELVAIHLGLQTAVGTALLMILIALLVFWGSALIERILAGWSFLLYAVYIVFVACYLWRYGGDMADALSGQPIAAGWLTNGVKYAGYNIAALPVILFCVKHMTSRRDAFTAGALAGPLAMLPAALFFFPMVAAYPSILDAAVPADYLLQSLTLPGLKMVFYIVVFGTFVETGSAYIHAVNERIDELYREKKRWMPPWLRPVVALGALLASIVLAEKIGLIELIGKGYGTLTWCFILLFIVPLCTRGVWRICRYTRSS